MVCECVNEGKEKELQVQFGGLKAVDGEGHELTKSTSLALFGGALGGRAAGGQRKEQGAGSSSRITY